MIALIFVSSLVHFEEPKRTQSHDEASHGFMVYLKRRDIQQFFIVCFLLQVSHGAYYTYFSIYMESLGYSTAQVGVLWSLGVIAEVLLFIYMHRWFGLHSIRLIMAISLLLTAFRWVVTGLLA
ncbi:MFS transporter, partial [Oleiphilus sp. HI0061]|uniref:MFS transporter n=1 Tax=Oleiphilus sp. HI0061 TaxID=1822239 RepID=UPI0018D28E54